MIDLKNENNNQKINLAEMLKALEWFSIDFETALNSEIRHLFEAVFMSVIVDYLDAEDLKKYIENSEVGNFGKYMEILLEIEDFEKKVNNRFYFEVVKSLNKQ